MSTVIRLARGGRKHLPVYRVSVSEKTKAPTGKFLQQIGYYDPSSKPKALKIDEASAIAWLEKGAQPSDTVKALFKHQGIYEKWEQVKKGAPLDQIEVQPKEWKTKKQKPSKKVLEKQKAEAEAKAEAEKTKQEEAAAKAEEAKAAKSKAEEAKADEAKAEETKTEAKAEAAPAEEKAEKAEEKSEEKPADK